MDNTQYCFENPKISWEQKGDVLEVQGILCEVGTYHPVLLIDGKPQKKKQTVRFDEHSITNIHSNLVDNFRLWLTHFHPDVDSIGWSVKYGLSDDNKQIHWKGLVFDKDAIHAILFEGYDKTSMEVFLDLDEEGYVRTGTITGNAFVKQPAISSAVPEVKKIAMEYGGIPLKPELVEILKNKGFTDEELEEVAGLVEDGAVEPPAVGNDPQDPPKDPVEPPVVDEPPKDPETPPAEPPVKEGGKEGNFGAQNMDEMKELKAQLASMQAKFEADNRKELDGIVSQLKGFGVDDPEGLVAGFSTEDKIKTLRAFSEKVVSQMPVVTHAAPTAEQKQQITFERNLAFQEAVKDLCVGDLVEQHLNIKVM
jgi:hypothetical protein